MREGEDVIRRVAREANRIKSQWLDECMNRMLPADIVQFANSDKGRHRQKAARYLQQAKIRLAEHPDKTVIMVDGNPVAEFAATFKDGKFEVTTRTLPPDRKDN